MPVYAVTGGLPICLAAGSAHRLHRCACPAQTLRNQRVWHGAKTISEQVWSLQLGHSKGIRAVRRESRWCNQGCDSSV